MAQSNNNIEAIIFDLGRVLVAIDNTLLVEQLFKGLSVNDPLFVQKTMYNEHMVAFNTGRIGLDEFYKRMRKAYQLEVSFNDFKPLWCSIFSPIDGMENLVMPLQGKVKLGLLSDTDPLHWNHILTHWPWLGVFKKPTLSFEVGVMKPDARIFLAAAKNVNTPPEQCLYIDDLEDNVQGARAVGMTAVRFESAQQLQGLLRQNLR